jgi:integrase
MNADGATAGWEPQATLGRGGELDGRYALDVWRAGELGVAAQQGKGTVTFASIGQPWLKEAVKAWSRQRLATGSAFNTVAAGVVAFKRFSGFLASCDPPVRRPEELDRPVIVTYLTWIATTNLAEPTKTASRVFLRAFLDENRRYGWLKGIPANSVVYPDELLAQRRYLPRFVPEFVMRQLESEANLARLRPSYRHLVVLMTETGLRAGDACSLTFEPLITDSSGWPCLRFNSWKMRAEQLVPLSVKAVDTIRAQQRHVEETSCGGSPWLFPARRDPRRPLSYGTFHGVFTDWQTDIGLQDEAGRSVRVTLHQLRHTMGTRLVNQGVPQHVIQRLGHVSPEMTAVYAHLHDSTIRKEFERYCQSRVDIEGQLLGFDPDAPTADAEWVKHNLARVADALPNGYCGRPPQQDCPHPNACLTCPDFQTTVQFLPIHHQQAENTRLLIAEADAAGRQRLAANHRRVLNNLEKIIPALEGLQRKEINGDG